MCYLLSKGNCYNADILVSTVSTKQEQAQNQETINQKSNEGLVAEIQLKQIDHSETQKEMSYVDEKMIQAVEATLINADSFDTDDKWVKRWEKVVRLRGKLYLLPGGAVGRKVVSVYADEIKRFGNGEQKS